MPLTKPHLLRITQSLLRIATAFSCFVLISLALTSLAAEDASEQLFTDDQWEEAASRSNIAGQNGDARSQGQEGHVQTSVLRMVLGLVVVIGVALLIAWLVRRSGLHRRLPGQRGEHLELLESLSLGPKRGVSLLRVGGQFVLVGHNEQSITALGNFDRVEAGKQSPTSSKSSTVSASPKNQAQVDSSPSLSSMVKEGDHYTATAVSETAPVDSRKSVDDFRQRLNRLLGGRS